MGRRHPKLSSAAATRGIAHCNDEDEPCAPPKPDEESEDEMPDQSPEAKAAEAIENRRPDIEQSEIRWEILRANAAHFLPLLKAWKTRLEQMAQVVMLRAVETEKRGESGSQDRHFAHEVEEDVERIATEIARLEEGAK